MMDNVRSTAMKHPLLRLFVLTGKDITVRL